MAWQPTHRVHHPIASFSSLGHGQPSLSPNAIWLCLQVKVIPYVKRRPSCSVKIQNSLTSNDSMRVDYGHLFIYHFINRLMTLQE